MLELACPTAGSSLPQVVLELLDFLCCCSISGGGAQF